MPPRELDPAIPPALEARRPARAGEGPGAAVRERRRVHRGAAGRARRRPTRSWSPPPRRSRRSSRRTTARAAAGGCGCWSLLALAAIASALYLLLKPKQVDVPNVIGRTSATASQILQNQGFEVADRPGRRTPTSPRDKVVAQSPRPGETANEGSAVHHRVSAGPGPGGGPERRRRCRRSDAEEQLRTRASSRRSTQEFSDDGHEGPRDQHVAGGRHDRRARHDGHADRLARARSRSRSRTSTARPRTTRAARSRAPGCGSARSPRRSPTRIRARSSTRARRPARRSRRATRST